MLRLCADKYCMEIDTTNKNWCKCWLVIDDNFTYIGAENLQYLKDHLLAGFDDSPKVISGNLHGYDFSWVLSLAEVHTTLYFAEDGQERILLFQDADGKEICTLKLSHNKYLEWRNQILSI